LKLHSNLLYGLFDCLNNTLNNKYYAHKSIELIFKKNKKWGSRDRSFVAEATYDIIRYLRLYDKLSNSNYSYTINNIWKIISLWLYFNSYLEPKFKELWDFDKEKINKIKKILLKERVYRESIPDWIDQLAIEEIGEKKWEKEISSMNNKADLVLRINPLKTTKKNLIKKLYNQNIHSEEITDRPNALKVLKRVNIFRTIEFKSGFFELQDASSQLVAKFLDVNAKHKILDACAGAGGKTLHIASILNNKGNIVATDIHEYKLQELKKRARRNGIHNITTKVIDNKFLKKNKNKFDRVLIDAPCSGFGVIRRNPDSKWKLNPKDFNSILNDQIKILNDYSKLVNDNGIMLYVTCSIFPSENEKQIELFLSSEFGKKFKIIEEKKISPYDSGYDGFYLAKLKKKC
jgi:16S rRNA (cytosine967-C5)-methyltransferase|tara:strand:- start:40123 stop:41334 length:1212 start_codon:yes stop_codon:yes gene_type:complete